MANRRRCHRYVRGCIVTWPFQSIRVLIVRSGDRGTPGLILSFVVNVETLDKLDPPGGYAWGEWGERGSQVC